MEKSSNKAAVKPLLAMNAAAGSTERDAASHPPELETLTLEPVAAPPPETFELPPSEFGDDLIMRFFLTRMDRLDDGVWRMVCFDELSIEELGRGMGFDGGEFAALTTEQQQMAAQFLVVGHDPDAAIKAARNNPTLKLVE